MKKWIVLAVVLVVGYFLLTHLRVRGKTIGGLPFDIGLGLGGSTTNDPTAQDIGAGLTGASELITAIGGAVAANKSSQPTGTA